jgi:hypothetical protein
MAARTYHLKGSPREVGFVLGHALGERLEQNIDRYITTGPTRHRVIDTSKPYRGALPWLHSLPHRFREEFEGMAEGASVSLQRLAEWCFVEGCVSNGYSGSVFLPEGSAWVARNNDIWAPDLWGYMTIREVDGRIPRIDFGLEGDLFTGTGINQEALWLHYNWLPIQDAPTPGKPHLACPVWLAEAVETCRTVAAVEALLSKANRDGGMMLFAVDGKTDEFAVFDCTCIDHSRRELSGYWIVGTNHSSAAGGMRVPDEHPTASQLRFECMEELLDQSWECGGVVDAPWDLVRILADPGVEVRGKDYGTAYANVACPSRHAIWYTFGGYTAASAGAWYPIQWPWERVPE